MSVFVLPPRESCSNRVSFESRYGMCFPLPSTKALITLPSADSDKLIWQPSFSRSPIIQGTQPILKPPISEDIEFGEEVPMAPVAPVLDWRSEPAKSTRLSLPARSLSLPSGPFSLASMITVKIEWLLLDPEFICQIK